MGYLYGNHTVAILVCLLGMGGYFLIDIPAAIGIDLKQYLTASSNQMPLSQSSFMQTFYSSLCGGGVTGSVLYGVYLSKFMTNSQSGIIFSALLLTSQIFLILGLYRRSLWIIAGGRWLQGFSMCVVNIAQMMYLDMYASTSFYYGALVMFKRGSSIASWFLAPNIICATVDSSASCIQQGNRTNSSTGVRLRHGRLDADGVDMVRTGLIGIYTICIAMVTFALIISSVLYHIDKSLSKSPRRQTTYSLLDIFGNISTKAWLAIGVFVLTFCPLYAMSSMMADYCKNHLGLNKNLASTYSSILSMVSLGAPLAGSVVDHWKIGKDTWALICCFTLLASQLIWGESLRQLSPTSSAAHALVAVFLLINGIFYTLFASMVFPWMASQVGQDYKIATFGMAFGLMQASLALISYAMGAGVDRFGWSYFPDIGGAILCVAFALTLVFKLLDRRLKDNNAPNKDAEAP